MAGKLNTITKLGTVRWFSQESLLGTVSVEGKLLDFSSLCFHSELPFRYPKMGELVRVTLSINTGNIVLVRGGVQ